MYCLFIMMNCYSIVTNMEALRTLVDEAEMIVDDRLWPFPGYGQLLTTK